MIKKLILSILLVSSNVHSALNTPTLSQELKAERVQTEAHKTEEMNQRSEKKEISLTPETRTKRGASPATAVVLLFGAVVVYTCYNSIFGGGTESN